MLYKLISKDKELVNTLNECFSINNVNESFSQWFKKYHNKCAALTHAYINDYVKNNGATIFTVDYDYLLGIKVTPVSSFKIQFDDFNNMFVIDKNIKTSNSSLVAHYQKMNVAGGVTDTKALMEIKEWSKGEPTRMMVNGKQVRGVKGVGVKLC